ncbi:Uncharacterised protein [Bordetella pertussis]|nr:Uncharacterised protein [Bordetella pertussis]
MTISAFGAAARASCASSPPHGSGLRTRRLLMCRMSAPAWHRRASSAAISAPPPGGW